jgi:CRP-like cAMP-binding protein
MSRQADLQRRIEILRQVSLFTELKNNDEGLSAIATATTEAAFPAGHAILTEGEVGTQMYILEKGRAGVFKRTLDGEEYRVVNLDGSQGAFFGEGALLDADARSATIRAETECVCLALEGKAFEDFSRAHPDWALPVLRRIARTVMARVRKSNDDMMLLYKALVGEIRGG